MMMLRVLLIATSIGLVGCAGGNDPAEAGTDAGSSGTTGDSDAASTSTTAPVTTTSSSTTNPTTAESSTTDAESSSSTSGDTTSAESSSTGACPLSTEGCGCDPASDPECGDGLVCSANDVCEAALCAEKKDEPNDSPFEPFALMDLSDNDDPVLYESQLSGEEDVDWFTYGCDDPLLGLSEPSVDFAVPDGVRACLFLACTGEANPIFECPEGTEAETAPIGFLPGCCVTGSASFEIASYMCPGTSNDALEAYLRVEDGAQECSDYSVTYGC